MNLAVTDQGEREQHLLALAEVCLGFLELDSSYGTGLTMDAKRPFGSSGSAALWDTLESAGIIVPEGLSDDEERDWLEYAHQPWTELPSFLATRVELRLKK